MTTNPDVFNEWFDEERGKVDFEIEDDVDECEEDLDFDDKDLL